MSLPLLFEKELEKLSTLNRRIALPVSREVCEKLGVYAEELSTWSEQVDLASPGTPLEMLRRHILDSVAASWVLREHVGGGVLDIGSGAGLPGVVLSVLFPDVRTVLLEPRGKRVEFLKEMRRLLSLDRTEIVQLRLENAAEIDGIQLAVARAVGDIGVLKGASQLLPSGGRIALLTGSESSSGEGDERCSAPAITEYRLPGYDRPRQVKVFHVKHFADRT